jgi:cytochrome P450
MWKAHRRLLTPSLSYNLLEKFVNIFESASNILVQKLSKMGDSDNFDIYPYMSRCIFDVVCGNNFLFLKVSKKKISIFLESIMGIELDVQNTETSHYFQSVKNICKIFMTRVTSVVKCYDFIHLFTKDYATEQESLKCLHDFAESVINKNLLTCSAHIPTAIF